MKEEELLEVGGEREEVEKEARELKVSFSTFLFELSSHLVSVFLLIGSLCTFIQSWEWAYGQTPEFSVEFENEFSFGTLVRPVLSSLSLFILLSPNLLLSPCFLRCRRKHPSPPNTV